MKFEKTMIQLPYNSKKHLVDVEGYTMDLELYGVDIDVVIGQIDKVKEIWKFATSCEGFVESAGKGRYILWLESKRNMGCIVHEVYHLVNSISRRAELSEDDQNEQQAYLMEYLFVQVRKLA